MPAARPRAGERDDVLHAAAATVARDLGVAYVAIDLPDAPELYCEYGKRAGEPVVTVALAYRGTTLGRLVVGGRLGYPQRRRLPATAAQLSLTAHTLLVSRRLARRGEEMLAAREEERRYLRRDLHDDLGPTLAAIAMTLEAASNLLGRDPMAAERLLTGVRDQSRDAVVDLRRIVSRLRPSTIDQMGLLTVVRELVAGYAREITLDLPDDVPQLPAAIEIAAVGIVKDALDHGAHRVRLSVDAALVVDLHGSALPVERLRERAAAVGGVIAEGGTMVRATFPAP